MIKKAFGTFAFTAAVTFGATAVQADELVVGGKGYTEQLLMASMTEQLLAGKGYDVEKRDGMGSSVLRKAQLNGQIDLYWEYTGTSLRSFNKIKDRMSAEEAYNTVKKLDGEQGLVWLNPSSANNTYALAVRGDDERTKDVNTLTELAALINSGTRMTFSTSIEFPVRPDGLKPFQKEYGVKFKRSEIKKMDPGLAYNALKVKEVDIALVFATDGRIGAFNFKVLEDDKGFFPDYSIVPVIRKDTLDKHPKLGELLNDLSGRIDNATMTRLNGEVDVNKRSIEDVAAEFLKQQGLL